MQLTPMMQQYRQDRRETPPSILMFRLGDFYEMFFEDAVTASRVLGITLTGRESEKNRVPMCGVPYHAAQEYIAKLIRAGHKVAVCDQIEDPSLAKGLVKREVTRVVTPGTALEEELLGAGSNNYLAAIHRAGPLRALLPRSLHRRVPRDRAFVRGGPAERDRPAVAERVLLPRALAEDAAFMKALRRVSDKLVNPCDDWLFEREGAFRRLRELFRTQSLDGFGCAGLTVAASAAGAAVQYLKDAGHASLAHVTKIVPYAADRALVIDLATQRNLELARNLRDGGREGTLLAVLDRTATAMGARLLKGWLLRPLADPDEISARLDGVEELAGNPAAAAALARLLADFKDTERLIARIDCGRANARDLLSLGQSLALLPALAETVASLKAPILAGARGLLEDAGDLAALIEKAIDPAAPLTIREGGIIRQGYDAALDEVRAVSRGGKEWIAALQKREAERTGIRSLKVGYNRVFGYYLEVTKANLGMVPPDYVRKQTLVNAERFVTPELKEHEERVLNAEGKAAAMEYELFGAIRERVVAETERIQRIGRGAALLDVLQALASVAKRNNYVRPVVNGADLIEIVDGRHPVIELSLAGERFVPNDTLLNTETDQLLIITGPNMAGKSTYIRQTALIVLMAQMGSFVPAARATIGVADRIFTRVGASDELSRGQSTFMVEMNETANILNNATERSLIVLDEIGRGPAPSTASASPGPWPSTCTTRRRCGPAPFATHYHELTELQMNLPGVKNYNVAVREWNDEIIFLRKIVPGGTDKSYGIHVARLAGLPGRVIERAKDILNALEDGCIREERLPQPEEQAGGPAPPRQMSLFDARPSPIAEQLRRLDLDRMTPLEAMHLLKRLKEMNDG